MNNGRTRVTPLGPPPEMMSTLVNTLDIWMMEMTTTSRMVGRRSGRAYHSPWSDRVRSKLALRRERRLFRLERCIRNG